MHQAGLVATKLDGARNRQMVQRKAHPLFTGTTMLIRMALRLHFQIRSQLYSSKIATFAITAQRRLVGRSRLGPIRHTRIRMHCKVQLERLASHLLLQRTAQQLLVCVAFPLRHLMMVAQVT